PQTVLGQGALSLSVNGRLRQQSDLSKLVWNIPELIADLSRYYHLLPGDLVFTGTPEGVGAVQAGDRIDGQIEGVGSIVLHVGPAA
ncbi:MAG TPA: fumarylacetoacetate hydrolase family protein, partial [Pseudorhodoferax sp.]|nr:fumarylacetoacetate hydrolase family protein [Pseudorhodoferax sp.]